jgi:hypothetical protein
MPLDLVGTLLGHPQELGDLDKASRLFLSRMIHFRQDYRRLRPR